MSTDGRVNPETLAEQLHSAAIHLLRQLRRANEASGTTAPRLSALSVIVFGGPIMLGKLAEVEQVRPPTMTRIVQALEAEGLVLKKRSASDGRVVHLSATAKGRRLLVGARGRRVRMLAGQIERMSAAEQAGLEAGVGVMRRLVEGMGGNAKANDGVEQATAKCGGPSLRSG